MTESEEMMMRQILILVTQEPKEEYELIVNYYKRVIQENKDQEALKKIEKYYGLNINREVN